MPTGLVRIIACGLTLALAGCALPRGAGLESEVLAASSRAEDGTPIYDFSVEPVTRAALDRYASWPAVGEPALRWITRQPEPANRILAAGDSVAITLWNNEENSLITGPGQRQTSLGEMTLSASGEIFLPYIGTVRIAGMSPEHARETVQQAFTEISPNAQVLLEMKEGAASSVALVGGAARPGSYPLVNQDYTVMELLADGGGVAPGLNNPQIRLIRGEQIYGTSVDRLFADPGLDTTLRRGDKLLIEADDRYFLSLGATGSEARHPFPQDRVTALEAMALVGGVTDNRADPKGILILREYPASALRPDGSGPLMARTVFTIDLTSADGLFSAGNFRVLSGDLVYATESPVTAAQSVLNIFGSALNIANRLQ